MEIVVKICKCGKIEEIIERKSLLFSAQLLKYRKKKSKKTHIHSVMSF